MKRIYKYLLLIMIFFIFLLFNILFNPLNLDEVWSYGFSNNIYLGLIPYKDFNMVITPLYSMIMALPMFIFGNNLLVFHIMNSLIITILIIIIYKLINEKVFIIIPLLIFPINIIFPNYNFFLLFLFVLLLYLEKNNKSDLLIGIIVSFIFLTKQTVGIMLVPVFLYYFGTNKFLKRLVGFIIPNIIFFIYLIITNSFKEFIDLCFLGLFDFGKGNTNIINIIFILSILLLIILLFLIKKDKKIYYFYLLGFFSICIPLFDLYHFSIYFVSFLIVIFMFYNIKINYKLIGISLFIGFISIYILKSNFNIKYYPNKINLFQYRYIDKDNIINTNEVIKCMEKYHNKVMFIGPNAYYYKMIADIRINYLDLINRGNYGYNGSSKLLKRVKELDDDYVFFVKKDELGNNKQTDKEIIKYILKKGKKIDRVYIYDIYRLGDLDD